MTAKILSGVAVLATFGVMSRVNAGNTNALADPATDNPVIARGTGFEITRAEWDKALASLKARVSNLTPEQVLLVKTQLLNQLINNRLLLAKATEEDKAAGTKAADLQMTAAVENAGSPDAFDRQLQAAGQTVAGWRAKITDTAVAQAVLERELKISVTDDEIKKYYDTHPYEFEQPELARVSHILIFTVDPVTRAPLPDDVLLSRRQLADDLILAARTGTDFAKLARQYSEDPGSKAGGGELLPFPRGQMAPGIDAVAFSLTNNQVSDVINTGDGLQIIKLLGKIPSKKASYLAAYADIEQGLTRQKFAQLAPPYLDGLRKASGVEILDPSLKPPAGAPNP